MALVIPELDSNIVPELDPIIVPEYNPIELEEGTTFGGVAKSIGAGLMAGATFIPQKAVSGIEVLEDITGMNLGGESMDAVVDNAVEFWRKRIGKSKAEQLIGQAAETIGAIGTTAAVSPQNILGILAIGSGLEKTAEELETGTPRLNAYGAGIVQAGTEYLTEKIPIGILQKPGISFLKRLVGGAISDVPGELLATAIEMKVIDEKILGKEPTSTEDFLQALKDTAMVSIISTIGLTGGSQILQGSSVMDGDVDPTQVISDALNAIAPPVEPRPVIQTEKVEIDEATSKDREAAKTEYPELESQTNWVNSEEQFEITNKTPPVADAEEDLPPDNTYAKILNDSRILSKKKRGFNGGRIWRSFITNFVDVSGNIKEKISKLGPDGQRVVAHRQAQAGATPKAHKELDIVRKSIYSGLNSNERLLFDGYLTGLRDLAHRNRFGVEYTTQGNATEQMIQDYIQAIPEKLKPEFDRRQKAFSAAMRAPLNLLLQERILTKKSYDRLVRHGEFYLPREVLDFIDPEVQIKNKAGKTITVRDSGLKNLSEDGSDKLVETDSEFLLKQVYERTFTRVFRNRANLAMLNIARTQPDNGIVREAKQKGVDSKGNPTYQSVDATESKISVMEKGVRKELILPAELAQEWVTSDPILSATMSNIIGWVSGNKILKSMATTLNPEFAITNIPRDLAHIYLTTQEYSSIAPIAALQMGNDLRSVIAQAVKAKGIKNTELYKQYIDNGGGTEFLTYQGQSGSQGKTAITRAFKGLEDVMASGGEFSEIVTRLALMKRSMANGKSVFEATQIARGYLDFSQGGSVAKALDAGIPFLNAAIQATRGITRAAKTNPKVFGVKVMQLTTMAMSLYWANKFMYGDEIDDIDDNEQKNNWIIMTPYTYVDQEGEERHYYIKIPKDQGQRVFTAIGEGMARKALGEQVDGGQIFNSIKDFLPVTPTDMPPTVEAILGYSVNKDFWKREDIWKGDDVLPQEEYNKYTPKAYVQLGEHTGTSPVRMKYALEQVFTRGNIWTSMVGYGAKQIFDELTPEQRAAETKELFERKPFVRRILSSTRPASKRDKEIKQEKIRISTERLKTNRQLDELVEAESLGRTDNAEINDYIRRFPKEERSRLRSRHKNLRRFQGVQDKGFWLDLSDLPPESRAVHYWNKWHQLNDNGRKELDIQSRRVPGFRSKRFNRSLNNMKRLEQ